MFSNKSVWEEKMAKIDLKLDQSKEGDFGNVDHNGKNYKYWREYRKNLNQPFLMVPSEVLSYVSYIRSKAISLYLYYCSRANNSTGKSWPSIETTAKDLRISSKSVNNWNNELEKLGLIARINDNKSSKTTYLLPVSDYYYLEKKLTPEWFCANINTKIDGELKGVIHLFQWRKGDSRNNIESYTEPYNVTCLFFQRKYEAEETNMDKKIFKITKIVLFEEEEYKNIRIDKSSDEFSAACPMYVFDTTERSYAENIPKYGVAISTKINLKESKNQDEVLDLLQQLARGIEDESILNKPEATIIEVENEIIV